MDVIFLLQFVIGYTFSLSSVVNILPWSLVASKMANGTRSGGHRYPCGVVGAER